jgi:hypothetical protein
VTTVALPNRANAVGEGVIFGSASLSGYCTEAALLRGRA